MRQRATREELCGGSPRERADECRVAGAFQRLGALKIGRRPNVGRIRQDAVLKSVRSYWLAVRWLWELHALLVLLPRAIQRQLCGSHDTGVL